MSRLSKTVRQMFVICGLLFIGGYRQSEQRLLQKRTLQEPKER